MLYLGTAGALQSPSFYTSCKLIKELPEGLNPPPPADANFMMDCRSLILGLETARRLVVAQVTRTDSPGTKGGTFAGASYILGPDGRQLNQALSIGWLSYLVFAVYLMLFEHRFGATLGKRLLNIRTISKDNPGRLGIAWRRTIIRTLGQLAFFILLIPDFLPTPIGAWAAGFILLWYLWNVIAIDRERDPLYDLLAGTAVVRCK
jgi:uncharacterized RDD family membrane protein YckC